ncbi:hypothetical protein ACLGIH_30875 [Streptomyces sp. HMX87]|uniref:hypothetical protein n=1 Tax=Streptomyces sp. HMX87 TaxID=3390849 RepID=UPI003A84A931
MTDATAWRRALAALAFPCTVAMSFGLATAAPGPDRSENRTDGAAPQPVPARIPLPTGCSRENLPVDDPARDRRAQAARAVAACLPGVAPAAGDPGTTLRAATLTVTGLFCPPGSTSCRATSVDMRAPRIDYTGPRGATCTVFGRLTLTGDVRLRAESLRGRVFGLLPVSLSTRAVPPLPVPYLLLTDVEARGLWARAGRVDAPATVIGTSSDCARTPAG